MSNVSIQKASKNKRIMYAVHMTIVLFFMFIFGHVVSPFGQVTPLGMNVVGVFIGLLWGWIFVDLGLTSLLGFVALGFTGFITISGALSSGMGNAGLLNCLMCFAFAGLMDACKVTDYIAAKILSSEVLIGRPWLIVFAAFVAMFFIGAAASGFAGCFLMWSILYKVAEMNDIPKDDKFMGFFICGACMIAISGANLIPFKPATAAFLSFQVAAIGQSPNALAFIIYNFVLTFALIFGLILVAKYILRLDTSKFVAKPDVFEHLRGAKIGFSQAVGLMSIVVFLVVMLIPCVLPADLGITKVCNNLGTVGIVAVLFVIVGVAFYVVEGEMFNAGKVFQKSMMWDVLLLLAVTFPLADAMKSPDTGVLLTIKGVLAPLLGDMPHILFYIVCMATVAIITQVVHNVVVGATFITLLAPLCLEIGADPNILFVMMFWGLQSAYATPAASAQSAAMHGNSWVAGKQAYQWGIIFMLLTLIFSAILGPTLGVMLF